MNTNDTPKRNTPTLHVWRVIWMILVLLALTSVPESSKSFEFCAQLSNPAILYLLVGMAGMIGINLDVRFAKYRRVMYYAKVTLVT